MIIMALGACNISFGSESAQEQTAETPVLETTAQPADEQGIKGNKETFDKAVELMSKKDFQGAISYLTAYINSKPKKYEAYKLRGDAFYALRQYALAQNDYQTAIDIKADDDKFMTGTKYISAIVLGADKQEQLQNPELGNLYGRLMYAQKALNNPAYEAAYEKAVEYNSHIYLPKPKKQEIAQINYPQKYGKILNPQGIDSYIYGAIEDIEKENFRDAVFKAQYITSNYPNYYLGYYLTGVSFVGLEQGKDAIVAFENALKLNPYDFESMASIAQAYFYDAEKTFSPSDAKKSNEYFKQALKYNPNCYIYYFYIGLNELQMGNIDSAITNFDKSIKLNANDYNSLYYKLIAQYIKGDYAEVVDGAANLLYKRVSNYNSVLYLRALAYNKLGSYDLALEDLNKIQNDINDIYNADIKVVSEKEKTLNSYVSYLKAQLMQNQGFGAIADMLNAVQNPIIKKLSTVENAIKSYEKSLDADEISLEAYNKYDNFYKSELPEMLASDIQITEADVDNQYDYIRTTFDTMGLSFVYQEPNYQFRTIDNYVYKKYASKLSAQDLQTLASDGTNDVSSDILLENKPLLRQKTSQVDMLASDSQASIAQMLASNSLGTVAVKPVSEVSVEDIVNVQTPSEEKIVQELPEAKVEETITSSGEAIEANVVAQSEPVAETIVAKADESVNDIQPDETQIIENKTVEASENEGPKPTLLEAPVQKSSETFTISYPEEKIAQAELEPVIQDNASLLEEHASPAIEEKSVSKVSDVVHVDKINIEDYVEPEAEAKEQEKVEDTIAKTDESEKAAEAALDSNSQVLEKRAVIDPQEFRLEKPYPVIDENTEVIELEPDNFMYSMGRQLAAGAYSYSQGQNFSNDVNSNKIAELSANDPVDKLEDSVDSEPIILPEPETSKVKEEPVAVPVVIVPELDAIKPEKETQSEVKVITQDTPLEEIIADKDSEQENDLLALRPQAEILEDTENVQTPSNEVIPENIISMQDNDVVETIPSTTEIAEQVVEPDKLTKAEQKAQAKAARAKEKEERRQMKLAQQAEKEAAAEKARELQVQEAARKQEEMAKVREEELLAKQQAKEAKEAQAKADAESKLESKQEAAERRKAEMEARAAEKIQAAEDRKAAKLTRAEEREARMKAEEAERLARFNEMKERRLAYLEEQKKLEEAKEAEKAAKAQEKEALKQAKAEEKLAKKQAKEIAAKANAEEKAAIAREKAEQKRALLEEKAAARAAEAQAREIQKAELQKEKQEAAFARAERILAQKQAKEAEEQAKQEEKLAREKEKQEQAAILAADKLARQAKAEEARQAEKLVKAQAKEAEAQAKAARKLKQEEEKAASKLEDAESSLENKEKSLEQNIKSSNGQTAKTKKKKKFNWWFKKDKSANVSKESVTEPPVRERKLIKELEK